jgi:serine protease Do
MANLKLLLPPALALSLFTATISSLSYSYSNAGKKNETPPEVLKQASQALHDVAKKATPAVVSITSIKSSDQQSEGMNFSPPEGSDPDQMMLGIGSGVIMSSDGLILTNYHVVENAERVTVTFDEKEKTPGYIVGGDPKTDLAVIRVKGKKNLPVIAFGDSNQLQAGDWTLAVGSPYGLNRSVTSGIVSAVGRGRLGMLDIEDFIQTDAAINPGNSGGPLLNSSGEMIGVNTAIFSQSGGFSGIGFAVPSNIAKKIFDEIIHHGRVIRGWIGMMAQDLDADLAKYFKVSQNQGALVSEIQAGSPAAQASLKIGDIIVQYGPNKVGSAGQLKSLVAATKSPKRVPIEVYRDGKIQELDVNIREQPLPNNLIPQQQAGQAAQSAKGKVHPNFGIMVQDIPQEILQLFQSSALSGALITGVKAGSPAFDAGLSIGDIILSANKHSIEDAKDFTDVMKHINKSDVAVFYIQRGPNEKLFIPVKRVVN